MLRPIQNGCHFADDIFNFILLNEICCALTDVSQTLFLRDQLTNRRHKIQMMVLHRSGDKPLSHSNDVIMSAIAQITSLTTVYSTVYSGADQRKHQSSASLAVVRGIHRWPMNSPHKGPVTRKMFPFDDVIMLNKWWPTLLMHVFFSRTRGVSRAHFCPYHMQYKYSI